MLTPRVAFVTIGQTPRKDVVPEMLSLLGAGPGEVESDEFGALDGLAESEIAAHGPGPREARLYTRLASGIHVVVSSGFIARRLEPLLHHLDSRGYDLIVLASTSIFQSFRLRTPLVHAQHVVDAWIAALVMGDCQLGLIHALAEQDRGPAHGTLIQNSRAVVVRGEIAGLDDAASRLEGADLILMHSVGYTEAEARQLAALTRKPVVTARRIIVGAVRLHLVGLSGSPILPPSTSSVTGTGLLAGLMERLPAEFERLTPRERDVLAAVLEGDGNKEIGRRLGISHRTVEIHRGRAMAKLNASSPTELIRRLLIVQGDSWSRPIPKQPAHQKGDSGLGDRADTGPPL